MSEYGINHYMALKSPDFVQGQKDGLVGSALIMLKVIDGTDKGLQQVANPELEKIRRVFLSWRDFIVEVKDSKDTSAKKALQVLVESKKLMES